MSAVMWIKNLVTSKVHVFKALDVARESQNIRFALDMGTYPLLSLQKDYEQTGLEVFLIEPLVQCSPEDLDEKLKECRELYKDRLYT